MKKFKRDYNFTLTDALFRDAKITKDGKTQVSTNIWDMEQDLIPLEHFFRWVIKHLVERL